MKYIFFILLTLAYGKLFSQNPTNSRGFGTWETIYNGDISNNGKWMFYESESEHGNDTLILREAYGNKQHKIPKGKWGAFTKNSKFFTVLSEHSELQTIDLVKNTVEVMDSIQSWNFTCDENFLIATKSSANATDLVIKDLSIKEEFSLSFVTEFLVHPSSNSLALIFKINGLMSLKILDLTTKELLTIKENNTSIFQNLTWSDDGKYLSFIEEPIATIAKPKFHICTGTKCQELETAKEPHLSNIQIRNDFIEISPNGEYVFFKGSSKKNDDVTLSPTGVQIWESTDKWIYPMRKANELLNPEYTMWSWNPKNNSIKAVTDTICTEMIKVNSDFVLKYDRLAYEPQYKYVSDVDFYLHNLKTATSHLLLEKQKLDEVFVGPNGENIVFFKNSQWISYNISKQKFYYLSTELQTSFIDIDNDRDDRKTPFSPRIKWVENQNAILVCDKFDVWKLSLDGKTQERLTQGKESNKTFRLVTDLISSKKTDPNLVNLERGLLLHAVDENRNSGYYLWQLNNPIIELAFGAFKVDQIKWDVNVEYITFRIQSYNMPPELFFYNKKETKKSILVRSNKNRTIVEWGKPELLEFTMKNGKPSKAFLIYPVHYNPNKEYPMIVDIYERPTEKMHEFYPISEYSTNGFNPAQYALDGYFILQPDIHYTIGNPGVSALEYVQESVDFVLNRVNIDSNKIGLYGFSFGGYESAYIATQTDRFAAVVAGAAITDLVTFYLAINWISGQEEMWRLENYQMRMGASYFDRKENYLKNSPFHSIENISTPILLWSGANDLHIDYHESIRFYLALRRLEKKTKLLLFENEGHNILDYDKRKYLNLEVKKWFDKYCK